MTPERWKRVETVFQGALERRLDSGPLPAPRAVEYAIQTARGLAAAHERFQSARDLAFALEAFTPSAVTEPSAAAGAYLAGASRQGSAVPSYHQLTFRRGLLSAARFSPDGNTVYYSAAWDAAGIDDVGDVLMTPDGWSYVYAARRSLGELYRVDGLR